MPLNRPRCQAYLKNFDFESLFLDELGWDGADRVRVSLEVEGVIYEVLVIAQKRGFIVYQCSTDKIPNKAACKALEQQLLSSHILILCNTEKTKQQWLWLKAEKGKASKLQTHLYQVSQSPEPLIQKLEAIEISLAEESTLTHVDVASRVKQGFDVERVTKQFFQDFAGLHQQFCLEITGIEVESDRHWYGSVLLNRLMFVYFLQRRYFLDSGDALYLQNKLKTANANNHNFYDFLKELFFKGFAEPETQRDAEIQQRIGKICYLNGGLFLKHSIEQKYQNIQISNPAFEQVLSLFSRYSWHLDDRPDKDPLEINPDVLGYIFEKYINQKEFGAYYTRPEITEYLCDRTINKLVIAKVNQRGHDFADLEALLTGLDADLCDALLNQILPTLTLLDPACGSGAFLVAAMKTLIALYLPIVAAAQSFSEHPQIAQWLTEANQHPSLDYYIKKRIITDNLYGVDIMEEATEIAKLRLFLALVASAKTVNDLEPLPNIDFNIMAGNSLIGLLRIDAEGFDRIGQTGKAKKGAAVDPTQVNLLGETVLQGNLLQGLAASAYQQILEDKNASIALYKKHAFLRTEQEELSQEVRLLQLRDHIDKLNRESQTKLNQLLLDEFTTKLGIFYEEAQLQGKPKKRPLTLADIEALQPFHWGYHFDAVFARGGFDAIIANPPWEVFKPNAKEFFANHSDLVSKKKMDIKAFEKEQKSLLTDPEITAAWLSYLSKFPYVSSYYRSADDYKNQISVVNGKKAGTDINLYKLFLERCFHLLRDSGECGIVIPSGIYTDLGTKQLRELLFTETEITGLFCFENRKEIFEGVHRSFKFVILTFEKAKNTESFPARFMRHDVAELAEFPSSEDIHLSVPLIRKLSPDSLSIMEFKQTIDIQIAEKMLQFPLLGEQIKGTWNLKLTREFDMTNDSHLFKTEAGPGRLPLYEGKMIHQFTHQFAKPRYWIDEQAGRQAVLGKNEVDTGQKLDYQDYRLGFRSAGENTNIRNFIATIIPSRSFAGNSLIVSQNQDFIFKSRVFALALFNSFLLDYGIRLKISRNMNMFYIYQLPVPRLQEGDEWFSEIVERAAKLICITPEFDELAQKVGIGSHQNGVTNETERGKLRAELDGIIAHLYGLTKTEFTHILSTFPIVPEPTKQAALQAYRDLS